MTDIQIKEFLVANIVEKCALRLVEEFKISTTEALRTIYHSHMYQALKEPDSYLTSQSEAYNYSILLETLTPPLQSCAARDTDCPQQ